MRTITAESLREVKPGAALLARLAQNASYRIGVDLAGTAGNVAFSCADAAERFAIRYRALRCERPPQLQAFAVHEVLGRTLFWIEGGNAYEWEDGPIDDNAVAFLADAVAIGGFMSGIPGVLSLHAAAFGDGRNACALTGTSTAGKSTTAIACVRRGLDLYSDERCIVGKDGVYPFARTINLRKDGIELLVRDARKSGSRLDATIRAHRGADWENVSFEDIFGTRTLPPVRPLAAVFSIAGMDREPSAVCAEPARLLTAVKQGAQMQARGLDRVTALLRLLSRVECYELTLGTPDATSALIAAILERRGAKTA